MSMSIAANVLIVLGDTFILLVAKLAIKRTKGSGNLALDRLFFGHFVLGFSVYKEPAHP